ncbi:MAG TPA: hypothetical protein VFU21_18240 [Kofleriaceae bacterium]|nr:hypothetical protein [Kofleriaceae bacterium]
MHRRVSLSAILLVAAACASDPAVETDEVSPDDAGKADGYLTELRVRAGETTLWADRFLVPRTRDGRNEWVLSARTSRTVTDGLSFIFDDVIGDFQVVSTRSFEVAYPAGDRGLMTGVSHFVRMHFAPSPSRPTTLTARAIYRPRLVSFSGSGAYLTAELRPVVVGGRVVWRVSGNASSALESVVARVGDLVLGSGDVHVVDSTHFTVDLLDDHVTALAAGDPLVLDIESATGSWQKRAGLAIGMKTLGLTTGDPVDVWPLPTCQDDVRACLAALPDGTSDTSSCGEALEVLLCGGGAGVVFDDVAFQAASARADDVIEGSLAADAGALAGADRAEELAFSVKQEIEGGLEQMIGEQFTSREAMDAAADAVIAGGVDHGYARPLDFFEGPHPAAPGSLPGTRQVVADALLLHLAGLDLENTEFGRPLEELTRLFRARHVADLRAFREEVEPVVDGAGNQVYIHNWLDPYVEVSVDPATGQVNRILFEID